MPKKRKRGVISHKDFVRDLSRGALGEDVAELFFLREFGVIAENVSDRNPDHDLLIKKLDPKVAKKPKVIPKKLIKKIFKDLGFHNKKELTVEVKLDEAAARYKNFFIEIFFDVDKGTPGTTYKCKADLLVWVVPSKKKFKIYLFNRPAFLSWIVQYIVESKKKIEFKTPGISPKARGIPVPIVEAEKSSACLGVFDFKL